MPTPLSLNEMSTIERRVHFALARFGHRTRRTEVLLVDSNGPHGGLDQHCTVHVVLAGLPPVVVEVVDVDPLAAVSRAVERVARRIRDSVSRQRDMVSLRVGSITSGMNIANSSDPPRRVAGETRTASNASVLSP